MCPPAAVENEIGGENEPLSLPAKQQRKLENEYSLEPLVDEYDLASFTIIHVRSPTRGGYRRGSTFTELPSQTFCHNKSYNRAMSRNTDYGPMFT